MFNYFWEAFDFIAEEFWNSLCWIWIFDHSARTIGQVPVAWERPPGRCKVAVFGA
jgi:hypothetical protein